MTRVKRSVHARKKRRATLERAKGFRGEAHSSYKRAKEAVMKADSYAYRDRRNRKRDFRRLWITRINAAARQNGMSYAHVHARPASWPASSSTARSWPTSPCATPRPSADLPSAPARRRRPDAPTDTEPSGRPSSPGRAPFLFRPDDHHQPPQRSAQGGPQARRPPLARQAARVRGRGRGPDRGRRRGRLGAAAAARAPRAPGWTATRSRRTLLARGLAARLGHARARASTRSAGRRARRAACASRCGAWATPATSARCCARALAFGAGSVALGPGSADPYGPKAVRASMGAIFAVPVARVRAVAELPGRDAWRSSRARASRSTRAAGRDVHAGRRRRARRACPTTWSPRATRSRHIPIARGVAERRDGRDRRAVRVRLGCRRR